MRQAVEESGAVLYEPEPKAYRRSFSEDPTAGSLRLAWVVERLELPT